MRVAEQDGASSDEKGDGGGGVRAEARVSGSVSCMHTVVPHLPRIENPPYYEFQCGTKQNWRFVGSIRCNTAVSGT